MLVRQRIILALLRAEGTVGRTQLMKCAFLLKQETNVEAVARFYDFLPYRHGPYSFALSQEMDTLLRNGYVGTIGTEKRWQLTDAGNSAACELPESLRALVRLITQQYGGESLAAILAHVYDTYPWFTVNSDGQHARRAVRSAAVCKVYSLGYQGVSVDRFLNEVMSLGLQTVIDVRNNAVSRRYGFHKATLTRLCGHLTLQYAHYPELGIPSDARERASATSEGYHALFHAYERDTLATETSAIVAVAETMRTSASVLVCTEADANACHRSRLATAVARRTQLQVEHLSL